MFIAVPSLLLTAAVASARNPTRPTLGSFHHHASTSHSASTFNPLHHLGGEAPYFSAPAQYGTSADLPSGCKIDQAAYLLRHGSRYPTTGSYSGWTTLYSKIQSATFAARGPLEFLPYWAPPVDDASNEVELLSGTGAKEAFDLGIQLRYLGLTPPGTNFTVWAASQERVVDTAQYFLDGYLAGGSYSFQSDRRIVEMADSVNYTFANSLTSTNSCPLYSNFSNQTSSSVYRANYLPAITARLNKYLSGLTLTTSDVGIMMDLCGFQTEISGYSPFCEIFTEDEWLDFEYAMDLQYYYGSGPGNALSGTTFWPYLHAVTELFEVGPGKTTNKTKGAFIPPPLLMSFTHDNDITPLISALGIFNESSYAPLDQTHPNPRRKFRTSYAITFAGRIALERLACSHDDRGVIKHVGNVTQTEPKTKSYVRIRVNDAVVPLATCSSGPGGSCPLASFSSYVAHRGRVVGDFVKACGQTAKNATSLFTAFTNPDGVL